MKFELKFSAYGDRAILVTWPNKIDETILKDILNFKSKLINLKLKQIVDIIHAYNSILIVYNIEYTDLLNELTSLKLLYNAEDKLVSNTTKIFEIPVCYDVSFGTDLKSFAKEKQMTIDEIIDIHTNAEYLVYFTGFLPGFLYLGGLDERLYLNRKSTPDLNIKKGSVAIGGKQTGIYPQNSPGGWHVIGNTPIPLFDVNRQPPCFMNAGDKLKFKAISLDTYFNIEETVGSSGVDINKFIVNA